MSSNTTTTNPLSLSPSAQLVASTLCESPEAAFLLNAEGVVLYENPAGKRLIFETTKHEFDKTAGDPKHSYHFSFFFSFASAHNNLPWQDYLDQLLLLEGDEEQRGDNNNQGESPTSAARRRRTFDVNDTGIHSQDYDVICKRTNGTEFPASLRLAKVGNCLEQQDAAAEDGSAAGAAALLLCAYVTPKVSFDQNNHPFAKEESSLKCILNASFDPVFSIDEFGTILFVNDAANKLFGYSTEEETHERLVGRNISIICGGGHAKHHDTYIRNYLDTGIAKIIGKKREVMAKRRDGSEFPVELGIKEVSCQEYGGSAAPGNGKVVFVAFLKDLSAQKQSAMELENNMNLMQTMINSSFDPMFQIDQQGQIRNCNNAAIALFGYSRKELLDGGNISMLCGTPEDAAQHDQYLQRYLKTGQKRVIGRKRKVTARRKDGTTFDIELGVQEVVIHNNNNNANNSDGKEEERFFCGFVRDLTKEQLNQRKMRSFEQNVRDNFFGDGGNSGSGNGSGSGGDGGNDTGKSSGGTTGTAGGAAPAAGRFGTGTRPRKKYDHATTM